MFVFAIESYSNSFQFSSKCSIASVVEYQGKGISISPESYKALFNYSLLCLKGKVEKHGAIDAKIILRALIRRGFSEAYAYLGWQSYIDKDYKSAYKYLTHKQAKSSAFKFNKLGILHSEGKACSINLDVAINYFEKASELDDVDSMFQLGKLYHSSAEFKDDKLAQEFLHKSIARGSSDAVIYFDDHYFKFRETFLDVTENFLATLTKAFEPEKKLPYRAPVKQKSNDLCLCGSGEKYKRCHGV
jgi:hypothetical protein